MAQWLSTQYKSLGVAGSSPGVRDEKFLGLTLELADFLLQLSTISSW